MSTVMLAALTGNLYSMGELQLTAKERRAMLLAAIAAVFPIAAAFAVMFLLGFSLLDWLWIR